MSLRLPKLRLPNLEPKLENKRKPRTSIYKIEAGSIFLLDEIHERYNDKLNIKCGHRVYIWVQRKMATRNIPNSKYHNIRICKLCVPILENKQDNYLGWEGTINLGSMRKYLKAGFEIVADSIKFNYTQVSYERFYRKIGVL